MKIELNVLSKVYKGENLSEAVALQMLHLALGNTSVEHDVVTAPVPMETKDVQVTTVEEQPKKPQLFCEKEAVGDKSDQAKQDQPPKQIAALVHSVVDEEVVTAEPTTPTERIMKQLNDTKPQNKIEGLEKLFTDNDFDDNAPDDVIDFDASALTPGGETVFGPVLFGRVTDAGCLLLRASYSCVSCGHEGYRYLHDGSTYAKCHDCNHKNEIVDASKYGINVMHNGEEMNVPEAIDGVHFKTI